MIGKRARTYSGKRVWNEVVNGMLRLMQIERAERPIVPSVAICTALGWKSSIMRSMLRRGKIASRISE